MTEYPLDALNVDKDIKRYFAALPTSSLGD